MPDGVTVAQQILALFVWVRILVRQPIYVFTKPFFGVWHSLVVRLVREQITDYGRKNSQTAETP